MAKKKGTHDDLDIQISYPDRSGTGPDLRDAVPIPGAGRFCVWGVVTGLDPVFTPKTDPIITDTSGNPIAGVDWRLIPTDTYPAAWAYYVWGMPNDVVFNIMVRLYDPDNPDTDLDSATVRYLKAGGAH